MVRHGSVETRGLTTGRTIRGVIAGSFAILLGSDALLHPRPGPWSIVAGAVLVISGVAMLMVAILGRFRPGL
jgi:hypothetical protein